MKVYYNSSLWGENKGPTGLPQRVNWQFEYRGTKHFIPFIYKFPRGIVFDVITILDENKLREYIKRYKTTEYRLTSLERRCAEQEHPYQAVSIMDIWINGNKIVDGYSSSSSVDIPLLQDNLELKLIKKAYSSILKDETSFGCARYCIPYPETDSKIKKILRFLRLDRVNSMKFSTHPVHWLLPLDINFEMNVEENQKEISFEHPTTGTRHRVYFNRGEIIEYPINSDGVPKIYAMQSIYEIVPPLPDGDSLQFNSSISYTVEPDKNDKFAPTSTASIGIIGGADGPTALFITSKGACSSVPSFQKEDIVHFIIEGINTKSCDGKEYDFY